MERGWWTLLVMFLVSLPVVAADQSILGLFLGSNEDSMIFLRIIYGMTIFVFIYKVSVESVFNNSGRSGSENRFKNLALVFSLAFVLIAEHFTSDVVLQSFGWLVALLGPVIILYGISGVFFRNTEGKFNWGRIILTLLLSLALFFLWGGNPAFAGEFAGTPIIGGGLSEFFQDISFIVTYEYGDYLLGAIFVALVIGVFSLGAWMLSRFGSGRGQGGSWSTPWKGILLVLAIAAALLILSYLSTAGFLGFFIPWGNLLLGILITLAIGFILYQLFKPRNGQPSYASRMIAWIAANPWTWWVFLALLLIAGLSAIGYFFGGSILGFLGAYWWIIGLVILALLLLGFLLYFGRGIGGWIRGDNIFVTFTYYQMRDDPSVTPRRPPELVTVPDPITAPFLPGRIGGRALHFFPRDPVTQIRATVRRGRGLRWSRPLENATLNLALQNGNGTISTNTITTNANGQEQFSFTPPNDSGANVLSVNFAHPDYGVGATRRSRRRIPPIPPFQIIIGIMPGGRPILSTDNNPIQITEGNDARFRVQIARAPYPGAAPVGGGPAPVINNDGRGLDGTEVTINFIAPAGRALPTPITGIITGGGATGNPSVIDVTVPAAELRRTMVGGAAVPYQARITASAPGLYQDPAAITRNINIDDQPQVHVRIVSGTGGNHTFREATPMPIRIEVRRGAGRAGNFNEEVEIELRWTGPPAVTSIPAIRQVIPAQPGLAGPAVLTFNPGGLLQSTNTTHIAGVGGAPGVDVGRHDFEIVILRAPTGFRAPVAVQTGRVDVEGLPTLALALNNITIQEDQVAAFTGRVTDGAGTGVACQIAIGSMHPALIHPQVIRTDAAGNFASNARQMVPANTLSATYTHTGATPAGQPTGAGIYYINATVSAAVAGYQLPGTQTDAHIQVTPIPVLPTMNAIVTWGPTRVNPSQRVDIDIQVIDPATGNGLPGIQITIGGTRAGATFTTGAGGRVTASPGPGFSTRTTGTQTIQIHIVDPTRTHQDITGQSIQVDVQAGIIPSGIGSAMF
jgi:hypothetical protein